MRGSRSVQLFLPTLLLALLPMLAGCFQIEYGILLEEDLSGEAVVEMTMDFDAAAHAIASIERQFQGLEGPPTDEEIAAAREEFMSEFDDGGDMDMDEMRAEIEADLPEGVHFIDAAQARDEGTVNVSIRLGFDHITRLEEVGLAPDEAPSDLEPFAFEFVDEGETILLRTNAINPVEEAREEAGDQLESMEGLMETMFGEMSVAFSLEAPFEIVEHNATTRDGDRLTWIYDFQAMSEGPGGSIMVRYRR